MSAIRARGEFRMSGMGPCEICDGPCSFVHAVCVLAMVLAERSLSVSQLACRKCH
jgi:hypothetical protein